MGHMIFPFHAYLLLKYFILYNIINEYNILQHIISKIILEHLDHSNPMYALIIYTTQSQCMRTWQSNRSPHWKRQTWYVSILASPVFRALDGSFILLFFTWGQVYILLSSTSHASLGWLLVDFGLSPIALSIVIWRVLLCSRMMGVISSATY